VPKNQISTEPKLMGRPLLFKRSYGIRFGVKWYLAYGALDQFAEGTWWQNKECIGLKADPKYQDLMIFPKYLAIDENHLNVV